MNARSNGNAYFRVSLDTLPNTTSSVYIFHRSGSEMLKAKGKQWEGFGKYACRVEFTGNTFTGDINFTLRNVSTSDAGRYRLLYRHSNNKYNTTDYIILVIDGKFSC